MRGILSIPTCTQYNIVRIKKTHIHILLKQMIIMFHVLDELLNSAQAGNKVTVMLLAKECQENGLATLYASDSLISMQFSEHMKLPQVFQPQL